MPPEIYPYNSRPVDDAQIQAIENIKTAFEVLTHIVTSEAVTRDPRRMAIVKTKLEEACMWAIKAVTHA